MTTLLSAGQFARLARTTKRTVLWYAEKDILLPFKVDESGYRFYKPEQIIDFQSILLMRKLGFSIDDIKAYLTRGRSLRDLFTQKRTDIEQQIGHLQRMLDSTQAFYSNLDATGTLVQPAIKQVKPFEIYFLYKEGPYASIIDYAAELKAAITAAPKNLVYLTAFMEGTYRPHKAKMKIGVVARPGLKFASNANVVKEKIPAYKALSFTNQGSTLLLSLLWQELGKYRRKHRLTPNSTLPFACVEFYTPDTSPYPDPEDSITAELHLPIV